MEILKRTKFIAAFVFLVAASAQARTGGMESGGGGAFLCAEPAPGRIYSELVDLWEARNLENWTLQYSEEEPMVQARRAIDRLKNFDSQFHAKTIENLNLVMERIFFLPDTVELAPPPDMQGAYKPPGCGLQGMMYWDGMRNRLSVSPRIFNLLRSKTDVAATYVHEAVYKTMREIQVPHSNSNFARRLVGCLFAKEGDCLSFTPIEDQLPTSRMVYRCRSEHTEFYQWVEQFTVHVIFRRINDSIYRAGARMEFPDHFFDDPAGTMGQLPITIQGLSDFGIEGAAINSVFIGGRPQGEPLQDHRYVAFPSDLFTTWNPGTVSPAELATCQLY